MQPGTSKVLRLPFAVQDKARVYSTYVGIWGTVKIMVPVWVPIIIRA